MINTFSEGDRVKVDSDMSIFSNVGPYVVPKGTGGILMSIFKDGSVYVHFDGYEKDILVPYHCLEHINE